MTYLCSPQSPSLSDNVASPAVTDNRSLKLSKTSLELATLYDKLRQLNSKWKELDRERQLYQRVEKFADDTRKQELDKLIRGVTLAIEAVTSVSTIIRDRVNELSRPHLKKLGVMDLPDEILVHIFDFVLPGSAMEERYSTKYLTPKAVDIKNTRLTCRRFYATSSRLLLPLMTITIEPESLATLEKVSKHPLISKGVRVLRVMTHYFPETLAQDFEAFTAHRADKLSRIFDYQCENLELRSPGQDGPDRLFWEKQRDMARQYLPSLQNIAKAWALPGFGDVPRVGDHDLVPEGTKEKEEADTVAIQRYQRLLQQGFEMYGQRFENQHAILNDGSFARIIGGAMSRMPLASRLEITGELHFSSSFQANPYSLLSDSDKDVLAYLTAPLSWTTAEESDLDLEPCPSHILFELPVAIHKAGTALTRLAIHAFPQWDYSKLVITEEVECALGQAVQGLTHLEFRPRESKGRDFWGQIGEGDLENILRFLGALLRNPKMQDLDFSCSVLNDVGSESIPPINVGQLLRHEYPYLKWVILEDVAVEPCDLIQLANGLDLDRLKFFWMRRIELLSGTWEETIDGLYNAFSGQTRYLGIELRDVRGGEYATFTEEEKHKILGEGEHVCFCESPVEKYIQGFLKINPLRDRSRFLSAGDG